jgi:DNA (cytosine-5)-methyltransferase 1
VTLKFIDLFAGIGGTRLAFESKPVSMECVFSSEWDVFAQKTYEANFGHKPHGDITKIQPDEIPDFDVLVGGFPCQPFSSIGKRQGFNHPTQGTLFGEIVKILSRPNQPKAFLLENVKGLTNHDDGNTWRVIQSELDRIGFDIVFDSILDAADYGVPQRRERVYIIGFRKDLKITREDFEAPTSHKNRVGIGQFIESGIDDRSISEHLQKAYIYKKDDGKPQVVTPDSDFPVKTLVSSYHKIQRLTGTFVADGPTGIRLLTENECKAIMGFPQDFKVPVSRTQMYRQFGNSVAVPVVRLLAQEIKKQLQ